MDAKEAIDQFRKDLQGREALGQQTFDIVGIRAYLDALEREAGLSENQRNRHHAALLANVAAQNQNALEMLRSVLEAGKTALNSLMIVNGGAVVALFGVMANLAGQRAGDGKALAINLALPLLMFGVGVLLAVVGFGLRYFSQDFYAVAGEGDWKLKAGHLFKAAAILVALTGYGFFGFAIFKAYEAVVLTFGA